MDWELHCKLYQRIEAIVGRMDQGRALALAERWIAWRLRVYPDGPRGWDHV